MKYHVAGMVATHDLSLCSVTEGKANMKNVHFAANIKGDDLHFDYRLKPGVCDTMNATFLMKKLGIVEE
jgi:DNA mismatch repair ATPase MutS